MDVHRRSYLTEAESPIVQKLPVYLGTLNSNELIRIIDDMKKARCQIMKYIFALVLDTTWKKFSAITSQNFLREPVIFLFYLLMPALCLKRRNLSTQFSIIGWSFVSSLYLAMGREEAFIVNIFPISFHPSRNFPNCLSDRLCSSFITNDIC